MTRCLRWRSTIVPNTIEKSATNSMYAPPMMPVASTDCVSMYTQNVSANHRKLVVMFASAVLTSTWMKVRMPFGGGSTAWPCRALGCVVSSPAAPIAPDFAGGGHAGRLPRGSGHAEPLRFLAVSRGRTPRARPSCRGTARARPATCRAPPRSYSRARSSRSRVRPPSSAVSSDLVLAAHRALRRRGCRPPPAVIVRPSASANRSDVAQSAAAARGR